MRLLSSLYALPGKLLGGLSGYAVAAFGYPAFFVATSCIGIPVAGDLPRGLANPGATDRRVGPARAGHDAALTGFAESRAGQRPKWHDILRWPP